MVTHSLKCHGRQRKKTKYRKIEQNRHLVQTLGATNLKREDNDLGPREGTDFPEQAES